MYDHQTGIVAHGSDHVYVVERSRGDDLSALPAIERDASSLLARWSVPAAVLAETTSDDEFRSAHEDGLLWVARGANRKLVGFALVKIADGHAHLEEIDVHPDHTGRGVGRSLVEAVCAWASSKGHSAVTLTAFRDVPWNAPFYARLGFRVLGQSELTGEKEVWWLNTFESEAEKQRVTDEYMSNRPLTAALEPIRIR